MNSFTSALLSMVMPQTCARRRAIGTPTSLGASWPQRSRDSACPTSATSLVQEAPRGFDDGPEVTFDVKRRVNVQNVRKSPPRGTGRLKPTFERVQERPM
jgi:hypothetical protein